MRRRGALCLAVVLPLLLGNACPVEWQLYDIQILQPRDEEDVTWMPRTLEFDLRQTVDLGSVEVRLNGVDVTSLFQFDPPSDERILAWADFVWDGGLIVQGANVLEVTADFPGRASTVSRSFEALGDPYADAVPSYSIGPDGGFGATGLPAIALGPPEGLGLFNGSLDVVALGRGGHIVLEFVDNAIVDGPGVDFTVFENPFLLDDGSGFTGPPFMEPGRVEVSQDGSTWQTFPCALSQSQEANLHPGCAGVYPVLSRSDPAFPHASIPSTVPIEDLIDQEIDFLVPPAGAGGDSFDLADVGLTWARFVKVTSASYVTSGAGSPGVGFDLDAAAAVNSVPATDLDGNGIPDAVE